MTKGDNNEIMDIPLYPPDRQYLRREEVVGLVRGYVPFVGWLVIGLQEYGCVKFAILGLALCFSLGS